MKLGHTAHAILDRAERWLSGPSDRLHGVGVALRVRQTAEALGCAPNGVQRAVSRLLAAGVLVRRPDPDSWRGFRYLIAHPTTWTYPDGATLHAWSGPEPVEVDGFAAPVLLFPKHAAPVDGPMDGCTPQGVHTRAGLAKRSSKDEIDFRAENEKVDGWWTKRQGRQVPLVDVVAAWLPAVLGEDWRRMLPPGFTVDLDLLHCRLVVQCADHLAALDDRGAGGWRPLPGWVRRVIRRVATRPACADDAAELARQETERAAEVVDLRDRARRDELIARWVNLDATAAQLAGRAGGVERLGALPRVTHHTPYPAQWLDHRDGDAPDDPGDDVAELLRQTRAGVDALRRGELAELDLIEAYADALADALDWHRRRLDAEAEAPEPDPVVELCARGGTNVPTLSGELDQAEHPHPDPDAEILAELQAGAAIEAPDPPEVPGVSPVERMRARLPWMRLQTWARECAERLPALRAAVRGGCGRAGLRGRLLAEAEEHLAHRPPDPAGGPPGDLSEPLRSCVHTRMTVQSEDSDDDPDTIHRGLGGERVPVVEESGGSSVAP